MLSWPNGLEWSGHKRRMNKGFNGRLTEIRNQACGQKFQERDNVNGQRLEHIVKTKLQTTRYLVRWHFRIYTLCWTGLGPEVQQKSCKPVNRRFMEKHWRSLADAMACLDHPWPNNQSPMERRTEESTRTVQSSNPGRTLKTSQPLMWMSFSSFYRMLFITISMLLLTQPEVDKLKNNKLFQTDESPAVIKYRQPETSALFLFSWMFPGY